MKKIISENAEKRFTRFVIISMISSLLMGITGFSMLFMPNATNRLIGIIIGIIIIIKAICIIYKFLKRDGTRLYLLNILYGSLLGIMGILILINPMIVNKFLTLVLGVFLIVFGATKLTYGIWLKVASDKSWLITLCTGLMIIFMGILAITNPFTGLAITSMIGALLLLTAILDISNLILMKKNTRYICEMFW